jgi:purine-nucleoside phosphorylase
MEKDGKDCRASAQDILARTGLEPKIGIVLGTGLGGLADELEEKVSIPYSEISGFPRSTAPGHEGAFYLGRFAGKEAAVMSGRFHCYEGYTGRETAYYVRVLRLMGVRTLIITNASGCINDRFSPGELMAVRDHICFFDVSPCKGENLFGERFFDMSQAYSGRLRDIAAASAQKLGITLREGVYAYMPGPQYETVAEVRALRLLGADAVGMSTVPEVIEAAHCSIETLCISCLSNYAAGVNDGILTHEEVTGAAKKMSRQLALLIKTVIAGL